MAKATIRITAEHAGSGVWDFECDGHGEKPFVLRRVSSSRHAQRVCEMHMDGKHPGQTARITVSSDYSGRTSRNYTAREGRDEPVYGTPDGAG